MVAFPGMVNAHTHLFQTLIRGLLDGFDFSEWLRRIYHCGLVLTTEDWLVSARLGAAESIRSGVTTIVDHQFLHDGTRWSEAIIKGVREVGPRIVLGRTSMDLGDLAPPQSLEPVEVALAHVDALLERHAAAISQGTVRILGGPNTPGLSASGDLCVAAADHARQRGIGLAMHVAEAAEAVEAVRRREGVDGVVRWLDGLGALLPGTIAAHAVHLQPDEIETLARHGVAVAHNPVSNLYLGDGIAPLADMLAAGVVVGLGSDGAASNGAQDMFEVMKLSLLLPRVTGRQPHRVTPLDVLRMATIDGARAAGLGDLTGSLEAGKRADLALVRLGREAHSMPVHDTVTELVLCGRAADVATVLVDGQVILEDGVLTTIDEDALLGDARRCGTELAGRLRTLN
jgi:5-methylthioadenosine/S-adenosylhomocysteine deaminase